MASDAQSTPPTCICGRPLTGTGVLVCSACSRAAADCRCRVRLHVKRTLPAGRAGGLFAGYEFEIIHDPRADRRTDV